MPQNIFPLRVYVEDTDFGGIVYHANYLKFFERARSEWAEDLGWGMEWQQAQGIYFTVRYADIHFLKPARVHQKLEVVSRVVQVRPASFISDQHLRPRDTNDTILCKAEIKIACVDRNLRPQVLPDELQNVLHELTTES
jgi:acyl-CoA thioester hydrolase